MPESESVVKALEWYLADDERSVEAGIMESVEKRPAFLALPLARELETLLREILGWFDSARSNPKAWRPVDLEAIKGFQKRARKVLPS